MAQTLTPNFQLRMYEQGDHPGAEALNQNWEDIDAALQEAAEAIAVLEEAVGLESSFLTFDDESATLPGSKRLVGSANQVVLTPADGDIVLSLPQSIHTAATPQFAAIHLGGANRVLTADLDDQLAIKRGTNPQILNIYNTTSGINHEFLLLGWQANVAYLQSTNVGGTARDLYVGTAGASSLYFRTGSTSRVQMDASGHLLWVSNNSLDVGGASNAPRSVYAGTSFVAPTGTYSAAALQFSGGVHVGFVRSTSSTRGIDVVDNSSAYIRLNDASQASWGLVVASASHIGFNSGALTQNGDATPDVLLFRGGAGILEQRNGTNAQTFRFYNTFTNASNFEYGYFGWDSNILTLSSGWAGTGVQRTMRIRASSISFQNASSGNEYGKWNSNGNFHVGRSSTVETGNPILFIHGGTGTASTGRSGALQVDATSRHLNIGGWNHVVIWTNVNDESAPTSGVKALECNTSGHTLFASHALPITSNAADLGAASFKWRDLLAAGRLLIGTATTSSIGTVLAAVKSQAGLSTLGGARVICLVNSNGSLNERLEIGLGFTAASTGQSPVLIGHQVTNSAGNTSGNLYFATRDVTTDTAASIRWEITAAGHLLAGANNSYDFCSASNRARGGFFGTHVSIGDNPATVGTIRLVESGTVVFRNAGNSGNFLALTMDQNQIVRLGSKDPDIIGGPNETDVVVGSFAKSLAFFSGDPVAQPGGYTVTGYVDRRTFNPSTVTLPQLAEVVATLMGDLAGETDVNTGLNLIGATVAA